MFWLRNKINSFSVMHSYLGGLIVTDFVSRLLQIFNSRTCQLVLGAGALELVGLKTISTKNLGNYL